MKQCIKCNKEHSNSGKFCSRSCANSRVVSEETKLKISIALKGKTSNTQTMSVEEQKARIEKVRHTRLQKYLSTPFEKLGVENRRRRVFEEQNFCCAKCGISEWQGFKLTLELEHKDGNNQNNSRENLEGLCPNCHSITDTWRGRNKPSKNGDNKVSDEFLINCLKNSDNIRQGLLKAGISAKGKNYKRAKELLNQTIRRCYI